MKFENQFDVEAPIDEVWPTLLDVERVAPNVPGASVLEKTSDDSYKVQIKVKVGPMSMIYAGDVEIVDKDEAAHKATMRVKMKESRGQGNATANVAMALAGDAAKTTANIDTDVELSGKVASMGRGVIQDVSASSCGRSRATCRRCSPPVAAPPRTHGRCREPTPGAGRLGGGHRAGAGRRCRLRCERDRTSAADSSASAAQATPPRPAAAPYQPPQSDDALDLGSIGGQVLLGQLRDPKKLGPLLAVVALIILLLRRRGD